MIFSLGEVLSVGCGILWAVAVVLFRKSGDFLSPLALNLLKNSIGLLLFLTSLWALNLSLLPSDVTLTDWILVAASGIAGIGFADTLFFAGLNRIGAARAAIVDGLNAPFVVAFSVVLLGESLHWGLFAALLLIGPAIFLSRDSSAAQSPQSISGYVLTASAIGLMALGHVLAKPVLDHCNPWWVATMRLMFGLLVLGFHGFFPRFRAQMATAFRANRGWKYTLPAIVFGTYLATITWIAGLQYETAATAGVLNQTGAISIVVLAWWLLDEPLGPRRLLALALSVSAAILASS